MADAGDQSPASVRVHHTRPTVDGMEAVGPRTPGVPPMRTDTQWTPRHAPTSKRRSSSYACVLGLRNEKVSASVTGGLGRLDGRVGDPGQIWRDGPAAARDAGFRAPSFTDRQMGQAVPGDDSGGGGDVSTVRRCSW